MSSPRQVLAGSRYLVTRRATQRQFLLRPSTMTNQIFAYCLALAAERTGVLLHAFCVLSDHWHAVVSDPEARLPEFLEHVHKLVAKAINASLGRWENLWSSEAPSAVCLEDDDAVLRKIAYTLANPVEAGLVSHGERWPGLRSTGHEVGRGATRTIRRPVVFFRADGNLPETVELRLTKPTILPDLSDAERALQIRHAVEDRERELREQILAEGRNFLGPAAVRRVNPFDSPKTREPRRALSPRIAVGDSNARVSAIRRIQTFVAEYRAALAKWRAGLREVLFPQGTYALRILACVACADPPS